MNDYQFVQTYQNNTLLRQSFFDLANTIFAIDFEPWYQAGAWDDNYRCYSYAKDHQIIANVSVNLMTVHLNGKEQSALQIGTVMTHPDYQGLGLADALITYVLNKYEAQVDFIYLFANQSVLDFYPKYGFVAQQESQIRLSVANQLRPMSANYRQLDIGVPGDFAILKKMAHKRIPNSQSLGISQNPSLLWFYFTLVFPKQLFYFEDQKTIIIAAENRDTLEVYDCIQDSASPIKPLLSQLINPNTKVIQLFFAIDNQEFELNYSSLTETDDYLFTRPAIFPKELAVLFPLTSHG